VAFILFRFSKQSHQVSPWLINSLDLPVCHKLTHRICNVDERMMPGVKYYVLIYLLSAHIPPKRVVKGQRIVNLVPTVLAEGREVLCACGLK
jgi:hypothetical protein